MNSETLLDIEDNLESAWQLRDTGNTDSKRLLSTVYEQLTAEEHTTAEKNRRRFARAQVIDAFLLRRACDFHQALMISLDATATLAELGEDLWLARSYGNLGSLYLHLGLHEDGVAAVETAQLGEGHGGLRKARLRHFYNRGALLRQSGADRHHDPG